MRALTVQQPWAWAIVQGGKLIENRTQLWTYRGPLAIHAGKVWSERGIDSPLVRGAFRDVTSRGAFNAEAWSSRGAIIGLVDLVDCHPDAGCCRPWGESAYVEHGGRSRRNVTHLVLENPRALAQPIYARGQMGMWNVPADITRQIEEAIR